MQKIRSINKHFAFDIISAYGDANDQFLLKSQCQNWIQIHSSQNLKDIISLPSQLKMAKLECYLPAEGSKFGQSQCLLSSKNSIIIGCPNEIGTETEIKNFNIENCQHMSNTLPLKGSKYCNISLNSAFQSQINFFKNISTDMDHSKIDINFNVPKNSKIASNQNNIYFATDNDNSSLVSFNLEKELLQFEFHLPDGSEENYIKECFFVPEQSRNERLICAYGNNWLAIGDLRMKGLISVTEFQNCSSAFPIFDTGLLKIYFGQDNFIKEYDFRRVQIKREPVLTHQYPIMNAQLLRNSMIGVQNNKQSGITLYTNSK